MRYNDAGVVYFIIRFNHTAALQTHIIIISYYYHYSECDVFITLKLLTRETMTKY